MKDSNGVKYGCNELAPKISSKRLRYGDIIFAHLTEKFIKENAPTSFVGAYLGMTACNSAVILMNMDDWQNFMRGTANGVEMRIQTFYGTFSDGSPLFTFRKLGSFLSYRLSPENLEPPPQPRTTPSIKRAIRMVKELQK
jgi:hypothetical protein